MAVSAIYYSQVSLELMNWAKLRVLQGFRTSLVCPCDGLGIVAKMYQIETL